MKTSPIPATIIPTSKGYVIYPPGSATSIGRYPTYADAVRCCRRNCWTFTMPNGGREPEYVPPLGLAWAVIGAALVCAGLLVTCS